eukprot:2713388-Alexandrium_andersonii.AAC.1
MTHVCSLLRRVPSGKFENERRTHVGQRSKNSDLRRTACAWGTDMLHVPKFLRAQWGTRRTLLNFSNAVEQPTHHSFPVSDACFAALFSEGRPIH